MISIKRIIASTVVAVTVLSQVAFATDMPKGDFSTNYIGWYKDGVVGSYRGATLYAGNAYKGIQEHLGDKGDDLEYYATCQFIICQACHDRYMETYNRPIVVTASNYNHTISHTDTPDIQACSASGLRFEGGLPGYKYTAECEDNPNLINWDSTHNVQDAKTMVVQYQYYAKCTCGNIQKQISAITKGNINPKHPSVDGTLDPVMGNSIRMFTDAPMICVPGLETVKNENYIYFNSNYAEFGKTYKIDFYQTSPEGVKTYIRSVNVYCNKIV